MGRLSENDTESVNSVLRRSHKKLEALILREREAGKKKGLPDELISGALIIALTRVLAFEISAAVTVKIGGNPSVKDVELRGLRVRDGLAGAIDHLVSIEFGEIDGTEDFPWPSRFKGTA